MNYIRKNQVGNFKEGDWVVITEAGHGTSVEDKGLVCKIAKIWDKSPTKQEYLSNRYLIEIDRNKKGNKDRFTEAQGLRLALEQEIPLNERSYEIY